MKLAAPAGTVPKVMALGALPEQSRWVESPPLMVPNVMAAIEGVSAVAQMAVSTEAQSLLKIEKCILIFVVMEVMPKRLDPCGSKCRGSAKPNLMQYKILTLYNTFRRKPCHF